MRSNANEEKTIQSTQTACDIIEAIGERGRASITEIAEDVDYSRSTVHYHLKTLQQNRYVIKDGRGFRLGLRMARIGDLALGHHRLSGFVEKAAEDLAAEVDGVAYVAVKEGDKLVWLYRSTTHEHDQIPMDVGMETDMHCTAYGQAILAYLPADVVDDLVDDDLPRETPQTLTDREALEERLVTIREIGFAYSAEEYREGISSVAAPIIDESIDEVVGAIGITDPDGRIDNPYKHTKARRFSDELPGLVQHAARIAGDRLGDA